MLIYFGLHILSKILIFIGLYISVIVTMKRQSRIVHRKLIKTLLYASLSKFFNRIPTGRILNKLSRDLMCLDRWICWTSFWGINKCILFFDEFLYVNLYNYSYGCYSNNNHYIFYE